MFLIASLLVVSVVYWISALLAESVFVSEAEDALPVVIRTGLGFFFSMMYFSAAWQIVSIQYAWLLGGLILVLYLYGKYGIQFISITASRIKANIREHAKCFLIFLVGANVFFTPLFIGNNFGPFTEGGGDVSIYSDVSHLMASSNLTETGHSGELSKLGENVKNVFDIHFDRHILNKIADKHYRTVDASKLNPPLAESPVNRVLALQSMSPFLYAPYGAYDFLSTTTNYAVYYGIQSFLYCIILVGIGVFFRMFGDKSAIIAVLVVFLSHALISVFYNMYAAQSFAIAFSVLILNALPYIRLNSWAGLRTYGGGLACLWAMYIHFLTIALPLAALAWTNRFFNFFEKKVESKAGVPEIGVNRKIAYFVSLLIFFSITLLLLIGGSKKSVLFIYDLLTSVFSGETNVFMGDKIQPFSWKWLAFLFGILSQQHFEPFTTEYRLLNMTVMFGAVVGISLLVLGAFQMFKIYKFEHCDKYQKHSFILYVLLIATVIPHLYVSQLALYTQAKGSQNTLVYFYVILLLPLAIGLSLGAKDIVIKRITKILFVMSFLFCVAIAIPRLVFVAKLAYGHDRAFILESSYFLEAEKIKKSDPTPFVLFEPRKSADLYMSDQPFFGLRVVPTRHLVLQKLNMTTRPVSSSTVHGSDLIETEDIPHLWLLRAERKDKWPSLGIYTYKWISQRLVDKKEPDILLFGNDYDRNFGERMLNVATKKMAKFSYVRNGSAMLYLPAGATGTLEVTLESRDEKNFEGIAKEVGERLKKGEMGSNVAMTTDGKFITLTTQLATADKPTLKTIARYSSEFWLNVSLNGKEL